MNEFLKLYVNKYATKKIHSFLVDGYKHFAIDPITSELTLIRRFDFESLAPLGQYEVHVRAMDGGVPLGATVSKCL